MENDELFDGILKKFVGNKSLSWEAIHAEEFYRDLNSDYFVVENHLNFLIGEGMLKESEEPNPYISLTRKGWYVMTNTEKAGYVAKLGNRLKKEQREKSTLTWAKWATIFAAVTIITWVVDKLLKR